MYKYEIIIYWDNQDSIYIAEVPELPGCFAHGQTYSGALSNVKKAIQLWINTAKEFGDLIPQPKGQRLIYA
jgi:predicted RNase H-like HicB family nuclease